MLWGCRESLPHTAFGTSSPLSSRVAVGVALRVGRQASACPQHCPTGAAEVSGVKGGRRPSRSDCGATLEAGGAAPHPARRRFNRDTTGLHTASAERSRPYVTHLTENGVDRRFIQVQVGHECDSSTAVYTHVSDDFMNTMLRKALAPALDPSTSTSKERR